RGQVRGEHPRLVLQALIKHDLAVLGAEGVAMREVQAVEADRRQRPDERLGGALEVHLVEQFLGGRLARIAGLQLRLADARVERLRLCLRKCGRREQGQRGGARQDVLLHGHGSLLWWLLAGESFGFLRGPYPHRPPTVPLTFSTSGSFHTLSKNSF